MTQIADAPGVTPRASWRLPCSATQLRSLTAWFSFIQGIKERLNVNVEFARPEDFVPPLPGSSGRHVFIASIGRVTFSHYDPYAQVLSKIVRGFERDLEDAGIFSTSGMVSPERLRALVEKIPERVYAKYPSLTKSAVREAVETFLSES